MSFTRDFVTRENLWQIASLVTQKIVIHGNSCIILYLITDCTGSCQNDSFRYSRWWKVSFSRSNEVWWCVIRLKPFLFVLNKLCFSFTFLKHKTTLCKQCRSWKNTRGITIAMHPYYGGPHASGNIALMVISIWHSCKMSLALELCDCFCHVMFFLSCILGIYYLNESILPMRSLDPFRR